MLYFLIMKETFYKIPGCPVRFALLADLHNAPFSDITDSLKRRRPQMIAVAGDVARGLRPETGLIIERQKNVLPFLRACAQIAPTYLSLGNHEMLLCDEDLTLLSESGATLLDNCFVEKDGLIIGGLTSAYATWYRKFRARTGTSERYPHRDYREYPAQMIPDTAWLNRFAAAPGYHILLCHHPEYFPLVPENVELVLSGHAHGGQWNFYSFKDHRWRGVFAPGQGLFPKYTSGVYDGRLIVSRGLSNPTKVPRILNPTEVVYVRG